MKRISFYLLAVAFVFALLIPNKAIAAGFPDVSHYKDEINYLKDKKIIKGYPDGSFQPTKPLTRLQAVTMLLKAKGVTDLKAPDPKLKDMKSGSYGYAEVAKAVHLGIISGKTAMDGSKYFDPNSHLTRAQMAKIIVEAEKYKIDDTNAYLDVKPNNGYRDHISTLTAAGITTGYTDGTFKPNVTVSRQHFSVFVARMLDDVYKTPLTIVEASFLKDKTKQYTWKYYNEGTATISTIYFSDDLFAEDPEWDQWERLQNGKITKFLEREKADGLYIGFPESEWEFELKYPLFPSKRWDNHSDMTNYTSFLVVSVDQIVNTPAGTFTNVVEVQSSDGWTEFFAPDVGVIKTLKNGKLFSELVKIENR